MYNVYVYLNFNFFNRFLNEYEFIFIKIKKKRFFHIY